MSIFASTILTYGNRILCVVLLLGVNIAISRGLGPAGRGTYAVFLLISTITLLTGNLGTNISSLRSIRKTDASMHSIVANALASVTAASLVVSSAVLASFPFCGTSIFRGLKLSWIAIAVSGAALLSISMTNSYLLLAENRVILVNLVDLVQSGSLFLGIICLLASHFRTVEAIMWMYLGSTAITCILSTSLILRYLTPAWDKLDWRVSYGLLKHGVIVLPVNVFQLLNGRVALFLLNMWSPAAQLGYFAVAISIAELLRHFAEAVRTVMFGELALRHGERAVRLTRSAARWILWAAVLGGVALIVLARPFVLIAFSAAYLPVVPLLSYIVAGSVCLAAASPMMSLMLMSGHGASQTRAAAVGMTLNMLLSVILIPSWGTMGAAVAYFVSFAALAISVYVDFFRYFGRTQGWTWLLPGRADWAILMEKIQLLLRPQAAPTVGTGRG